LLDQAAGDPQLYLLPALVGAQPCFRLCYGQFADREEAAAARLPDGLRQAGMEPRVRALHEVLE
jgi:hypothetical protein